MEDNKDVLIDKLIEKLQQLYKKQADFTTEMQNLQEELNRLKEAPDTGIKAQETKETTAFKPTLEQLIIQRTESNNLPVTTKTPTDSAKNTNTPAKEIIVQPVTAPQTTKQKAPKTKSSIEKFIGENLLNKIGIIIIVIGVAIGAKYSIENELISPLTRIILGYFSAIGLLGFGIKLKKNYEAYSAVLVSGAIVILYFITYFAYSFYSLIPQLFAFALMVLFTIFTVVTAINYNRQIIAHLGLVGAYAVPFLLSNNSGQVEILFSYIAIINVGILFISFKKYWKSLFYSSFVFTWLIYSAWFITEYDADSHFTIAFSFLALFFVIFYITFLAYKMIKKETYAISDVVLMLVNSFIFYGFGYLLLDTHTPNSEILGVFTLCNAIVHFIVAVIIYKQKLGDKNLFYLALGLVLVFITITIPVQLDGNWVTLLWAGEAAILFWIGRAKNISVYEKLSYPLMFLAFFSLLQDWSYAYGYFYVSGDQFSPILNVHFLSSVLFIAVFGFIVYLMQRKTNASAFKTNSIWYKLMSFSAAGMLLLSTYFAFRLEISAYWEQLITDSSLKITNENDYSNSITNYALEHFKSVWIINYSLLFVSVVWLFNSRYVKNRALSYIAVGLTLATIFVFLTQGLYTLSELRETYMEPSEYYQRGTMYLALRYISFLFLALALFVCNRHMQKNKANKIIKVFYDILLHLSIVWVLSSELLHWMDLFESTQSYKLGLSILWGVYSFLLIAFGIWKNKMYLRIGGMALFAITLLKLFFYDISHLNTISKTIVFLSLGVLLLIVSFLYNKYKTRIDDTEN